MLWEDNLFCFLKKKGKKHTEKHGVGVVDKNPRIFAAVSSSVGCVRKNNEDNFLLGRFKNETMENTCVFDWDTAGGKWLLVGIFDGMGGGDAGEIAAQLTAKVFATAFEKLNESTRLAEVDIIMRSSFLDANNLIVDMQRECGIYGTTGTVLVINGSLWKVYHVGDSRAYLFREGQLIQQTRDQTLAQMKIDVGIYSAEDPRVSEEKHKLTEYIGKDQTKAHLRPLESDWMEAKPGDNFLLCSDGLYDMCSDQEITAIIEIAEEPCKCVEYLVEAACAHGGDDNVTCVCLQIGQWT